MKNAASPGAWFRHFRQKDKHIKNSRNLKEQYQNLFLMLPTIILRPFHYRGAEVIALDTGVDKLLE